MRKEFIWWKILSWDFTGCFGDVFLKLFNLCTVVFKEDVLSHEKMEEFLFDFGIHKNFIGNIDDNLIFVDVSFKPRFSCKFEDHVKRDNIFSFNLFSGANTLLISFFVTFICEILDEGNEDIFRVVFLKFELWVCISIMQLCTTCSFNVSILPYSIRKWRTDMVHKCDWYKWIKYSSLGKIN